jgi:hypothetical protein
MELKSWYSVCTPHEDIKKGNLNESSFAIDLWGVITGNAPEMYLDSEEFFKKTYFTEGLKSVLTKAAKVLYGISESSERILGLQTSFGGGKTHLLSALYHLAKSPNIEELLRTLNIDLTEIKPTKVNVAVFTNKTCDATQGRKLPDGTHLKTMWGEIAYQLGGKELYSIIEENDKSRVSPQGLFETILAKASPCLVLIDELADYCVAASGIKIEKTTLADQTISFIQQLSGAVAKTPKAMMVATLPASHIEVGGGTLGQSVLDALETRYFREAVDVKPVQDEEIYEVIRKRLFDSVGAEKETVAKAYYQMYKDHSSDVPSEVLKSAYKTLIERSYPFHPELIEALYHRWGSHSLFQRTRGVLRLLATLVSDQWHRKNSNSQKCALIHPNHIPWSSDAWGGTLSRLWGNPYQSVVAADISGENANAVQADKRKNGEYETERITEGIASAILLNSFGSKPERAGLNIKEIKLACSQPHLNWGIIDGALIELEENAFYLHTTSGQEKRFWFNIKPTINKLIHQRTVTLGENNFLNKVEEDLKSHLGRLKQEIFPKILVNPGTDLAEQKSLTLIILSPSLQWIEDNPKNPAKDLIHRISKYCGTKERLYRNTLLFLSATEIGARNLQNAYRDKAVIESILNDYNSQLDNEQKAELKSKSENAKKFFEDTYSTAYTAVARVEKDNVHSLFLSEPGTGLKNFLEAVWKNVVNEEWIQKKIGTATFEECGLIPKEGGMRVKDAVDSFLRFTDKPIIPNLKVAIDAVSKAAQDGRVGIGIGTAINSLNKKYCKNIPSSIDWQDDGVWIIPPFEPEPAAQPEKPDVVKPPFSQPTVTEPKPAEVKEGSSVRQIVVSGEVPLEEWAQIFRSFIQPSTQMNLKKQKLSIRFEFELGSSSPITPGDNGVKAMQESAKQLGLKCEIL